MVKSVRFLLLLIAFVSMQIVAWGQPQERLVQVQVTPDHTNWLYKPGEKVKFKVTVLKCNIPQDNLEVRYEISEDMMKPHQTGKQPLKNEKLEINAGTMKKEGFLRCRAFVTCQGREYEGVATVGFSPEKLQPTTPLPADFLEFWKSTKEAAEKWALEPIMTLLPERCTDKVNVYHVSFANNDYASRMYGILCVPKASGKYPAILKVPGAGIRAYNGEAERAGKGFIILEIGIHGIPVNLTGDVYHRLYNGALKNYHSFNMDNRDKYYYKRVYTGCVRAVDFLCSLPEFDGKTIGVTGGSQGGALSIVTTALDPRIRFMALNHPALCDFAGYLNHRAGGWPHYFREKQPKPGEVEALSYYDVVNFAKRVKVPGWFTWGYNDVVCPPTSMYAAYNVIPAPKELHLYLDSGHWIYPEQAKASNKWLKEHCGIR